MRIKQNLEEYIKKEEVEKIYDYQKKSFETKIQDLQSNINKIEDCLSLRFGEDIKDNKYDIELEEIKKKLDDLISNSIDDKKMKSELSKIAFDIQIEIDKKINSEKFELEKFSNEVIEEINKIIENTKKREENLAQNSKKYIEELKLKLNDIAKDGRSRTAIGKQEKTIKAMEASRKEIYAEIENTKNLIYNKIEKLNYNETIKNINSYIKNIEEENFTEYENNKKNIENLKNVLTNEINNKIKELNFEETINEIKNEIKENVEQTENGLEYNENKIQLLENTLNNQINNKIESLNYTNTIEELENKIKEHKEEVETNTKSSIKQEIAKLNYSETIEQLQNKINEEKQNKQGQIEIIKENINDIEQKIENKIKESKTEIECSTTNNIKEEIEKLNYSGTVEELKNNILNVHNQIKSLENSNNEKIQEINNKFEEINIDEIKDELSNNLKTMDSLEKQIQAVLDIVMNLEDKFSNITCFGELQENEIEKIINKKMKAMEAKYLKIYENKLKNTDNNIRVQERAQIYINKEEIKRRDSYSNNREITDFNKKIYEIPVVKEKKIYPEIDIKEKISAEPVYNPSLEEMLNKLKNTKIGTGNLERSVKNINQILGYINDEDADY